MHNWEVLVQFSVNGAGKQLFGDGFAFWYTKERNELGEYGSHHQLVCDHLLQVQSWVTKISSLD